MGVYVGDVTALQFLQLHAGGKAPLQLLAAGVSARHGMHAMQHTIP